MTRRGRPKHPDLLTPREREVLGLLREDLSNEQISQRLGITVAGVKYHVSEILGKLGVASRVEAVAWYRAEAPDRRLWLTSPLLFVRKVTLPVLGAGAAAAAVIVFIGILVWGLNRSGWPRPHAANSSAYACAAPTATRLDGEFPTLVASRDIAAGTALTPDMVCMAFVDALIPNFKWDACGIEHEDAVTAIRRGQEIATTMLQVRQSPGLGLECDVPESYTFEGVVPTAELNSIPEGSRMVVISNTTPLVKGRFSPKGPIDGGGKTQRGLFSLSSAASMDQLPRHLPWLLHLKPETQLQGKVIWNGAPVPGSDLRVCLSTCNGLRNGEYAFVGLAPGVYATAVEFVGNSNEPAGRVTLGQGALVMVPREEVVNELIDLTTTAGEVVGVVALPLAVGHAFLHFESPSIGQSWVENGNFALLLPPGCYTVRAGAWPWDPWDQDNPHYTEFTFGITAGRTTNVGNLDVASDLSTVLRPASSPAAPTCASPTPPEH